MNEFREQPDSVRRDVGPLANMENALKTDRKTFSPPLQRIIDVRDPEGTAHLRHFLEVIGKYRWSIIGFVVLATAAAAFVTVSLQPLYEATAKINVERRGTGGLIGQQAGLPAVNSDLDQIMGTQVEVIKSDPVLRPTTEKYKLLDVEKQFRGLTPDEASRLRGAPIKLKRLKVARIDNTYLIKLSYRAPDPALAANVANGIAASYLAHAFDSRDRSYLQVSEAISHQMKDLEAKMNTSREALVEFDKQLNVVDPEQRINILSARLLQLNNDFTAAQTERLRKEALLDTAKSGSLAAAQVSSHAEILDSLIQQLNQARQEFAVVRTTYAENHPEYKKAYNKLNELENQFQELRTNTLQRVQEDYNQAVAREQMAHKLVDATKADVDQLSNKALEFQELKSEADSYNKLYEDLQRVTQEEDINRSFQDAVIQIEEPARAASEKAFPIMWLNLLITVLASTMAGIGGAILYDTLDLKIRGTDQITKKLNVDVIASLPRRKRALALPGPKRVSRVVGKMPSGQRTKMLTQYQESIRALRNNIDLAEGSLRSLLLTSASPAEGKSTIAANLAFSYALLGKKILLIDADMRRPSLHEIFEKKVEHGLAELMESKAGWSTSVLKVAREELYLIPAGQISDKSADLIKSELGTLLNEAYEQFDMVIIDGPPLLSAPEAIQLAALASGVLVCARADTSSATKLASAYALLRRARAKTIGLVLDDVRGGGIAEYGLYGARALKSA